MQSKRFSYLFRARIFIVVANIRAVGLVFDQPIFVDAILRLTPSERVGFRGVVLLVLKEGHDAFLEVHGGEIVVLVEVDRGDDALIPDEHRRIACQSAQRETVDHAVRMCPVEKSSIAQLKRKVT